MISSIFGRSRRNKFLSWAGMMTRATNNPETTSYFHKRSPRIPEWIRNLEVEHDKDQGILQDDDDELFQGQESVEARRLDTIEEEVDAGQENLNCRGSKNSYHTLQFTSKNRNMTEGLEEHRLDIILYVSFPESWEQHTPSINHINNIVRTGDFGSPYPPKDIWYRIPNATLPYSKHWTRTELQLWHGTLTANLKEIRRSLHELEFRYSVMGMRSEDTFHNTIHIGYHQERMQLLSDQHNLSTECELVNSELLWREVREVPPYLYASRSEAPLYQEQGRYHTQPQPPPQPPRSSRRITSTTNTFHQNTKPQHTPPVKPRAPALPSPKNPKQHLAAYNQRWQDLHAREHTLPLSIFSLPQTILALSSLAPGSPTNNFNLSSCHLTISNFNCFLNPSRRLLPSTSKLPPPPPPLPEHKNPKPPSPSLQSLAWFKFGFGSHSGRKSKA